jgi:hypothetical protein
MKEDRILNGKKSMRLYRIMIIINILINFAILIFYTISDSFDVA